MENSPYGYQKTQNIKYQNPEAVYDKWIRINRNINKYTDANTMLQNIREAFILVETVMYNTLQEYKKNYMSYGTPVEGKRNTYTFSYETGELTIDFSDKSPFSMGKTLNMIGYSLPKELDETRKLRNFVSHNLETTTADYFRDNMNYDIVKRAMNYLGETLHCLNMMRREDINPSFECLRAKVGETVGLSHEFTVDRFIAQSGTSRLYEGRHMRLNVRVAIKELMPKTYSEGLLMQERDLLVSLMHPQIPRVYDVFNQNGTFYIVMDYIDGVGLDKYVKNNNLSMQEKIRILIDMCEVINYLHDKKQMVHTDLKPQNVMIDTDGMVHIIDFGTAVNKQQTPELRSVSGGYTAPEVVEGKAFDYRIDLYSVGAIIRYVFSEELAWNANEYNEYYANIQRIVDRCMEHNPYARYNNVVEIRYELSSLVGGVTPTAVKISKPKKKGNVLRTIAYIFFVLVIVASFGLKIFDYVKKNKESKKDETTQQTGETVIDNNIHTVNVSDAEALEAFIKLEQQAWECYISGDEQGFVNLFVFDAGAEQSLRDTFRQNYKDMKDIYTDCDYVLLCNEDGMCYGSVTRTLVSGDAGNMSYVRREFTYPFSYVDGEWRFDITAETNVVTDKKFRENVYKLLPDNFSAARKDGRNFALLCGNNFIWTDKTLVYEGMVDGSAVAASQLADGSVEVVVSVKNGTAKECNINSCTVNLTTANGDVIISDYKAEVSASIIANTSDLITFIVPKDAIQNIAVVWGVMNAGVVIE